MEVVAAILGSAVTETCRSLCGYYPSIKNFISFQSNLSALEKEKKSLVDLKNKVIEDADYSSDAQMTQWLREVEEILLEVNSVPTGITANNGKLCGCFFNCSERYRLSKETARMLKEVERLLRAGDIAAKMVGRNYLTKAVEYIPGPSIVNQTTGSQHLAKVMDLLNDDDGLRIGVWGMGGVDLYYLGIHVNVNCQFTSKLTRDVSAQSCHELTRVLPLSDLNENTIQEIRGDELWWSILEQGSDNNTKECLQSFFRPVKAEIIQPEIYWG
ncbi:hypothetical protein Q3G72_033394 [Acer saccharum]|nr:hypothetical protein Q3G72_033394 [Acer saccharum]